MVGDVITKYYELRAELTFPCYVYGDQVVGLAGEHSEIVKYYRLTLAGICFGVIFAIWFLYLVCVPMCINYVPMDDMLTNNKPKNHVQENTKTELSDSLILIRQDSSL
jgi:hypothetical protein